MKRLPLRLFFTAVLSASLMSFVACGPGSSGDGDGDGDGDCTDATSCGGGQICDPTNNECVDDKACTDHPECGVGGNCNVGGQCEASGTGSPCLTDTQCQRGEDCVGAADPDNGYCGCEGEAFEPTLIPPNLLVVFDQSGSMNEPGGGGMSKLQIAKAAVEGLVTGYPSIRYGLSPYPNGNNNCNPGQIQVGIADNTGSTVLTATNALNAGGGTPIGRTLNAHLGYAGLQDVDHPNFILLITDGDDTCNNSNGPAAASAHLAQGTKTFVVGFGQQVDANELNQMAENGGTAFAGATKYYQADDATQLNAALDAIGGSALGCNFMLNADMDASIFVHFNDQSIAEDPVNGWTYDPATMTLTFNGTSCDELRGGSVDDLNIVNSCPVFVP